MKKLFICALSILALVSAFSSCGSRQCNICEESCSAKYSFKDGEVVLCGSCYKECFETKTPVVADDFFAAE